MIAVGTSVAANAAEISTALSPAEIIEDMTVRLRERAAVLLCRIEWDGTTVKHSIIERWKDANADVVDFYLKLLTTIDHRRDKQVSYYCIVLISKDRGTLLPISAGMIQHESIDGRRGPLTPIPAYKAMWLKVLAAPSP